MISREVQNSYRDLQTSREVWNSSLSLHCYCFGWTIPQLQEVREVGFRSSWSSSAYPQWTLLPLGKPQQAPKVIVNEGVSTTEIRCVEIEAPWQSCWTIIRSTALGRHYNLDYLRVGCQYQQWSRPSLWCEAGIVQLRPSCHLCEIHCWQTIKNWLDFKSKANESYCLYDSGPMVRH